MKRSLILAIVLSLVAAPVWAEDVDTAKIKACVAKAGDDSCIGIVSEACMQALETPSTANMGECFNKENSIWDAMLNRDYKALMAESKPKEAAALKETQRQWIKFRDAKCGFISAHEGTMYVNLTQGCYQIETARQAMWLHHWNAQPK